MKTLILAPPPAGTVFPKTQRWWAPDNKHIVFTQYNLQFQPTYDTTEYSEQFLMPQKRELKFHPVSTQCATGSV